MIIQLLLHFLAKLKPQSSFSEIRIKRTARSIQCFLFHTAQIPKLVYDIKGTHSALFCFRFGSTQANLGALLHQAANLLHSSPNAASVAGVEALSTTFDQALTLSYIKGPRESVSERVLVK